MTVSAVFPSSARSLHVSAPDGLRLHLREYGERLTCPEPAIVCLPGLARTADDFDVLAVALAYDRERPRRVLALDYRGRGGSARDPDWKNYDVRVELADTLAVLDACGVSKAVFIGTSRGGLITMALAAARPAMIAGAVLNDIGPVIEAQGLLRIRGYVGKLPQPRDWREAGEILRRISDNQFPAIDLDGWSELARLTWREENGRLVPAYDPNLMRPLAEIDFEKPLPALWPFFEALALFPVLTLRGENSDILSEETLDEMQARHPAMEIFRVRDQGHAPLLRDGPTIERIRRFLRGIEQRT